MLIERAIKSGLCAVICMLMSCASPQDNRAARFDGDWRALMRETESVQQVQNLRFDCAPFTETFFIRVKNGVASGFMEADENYSFSTPLDQRGRFKALIPTNSVYTYKDAQVSRESSIVLVLEGALSTRKKTGVFVIGDQAIDGQGCATQVQFVAV